MALLLQWSSDCWWHFCIWQWNIQHNE